MWLEPAAGLVSMQLGKVFDHTKEEYFHVPLEQEQSHWSEPYKDIVGAKATGSKVTLRHVNDDIKNVFKLTGFINIFEFE